MSRGLRILLRWLALIFRGFNHEKLDRVIQMRYIEERRRFRKIHGLDFFSFQFVCFIQRYNLAAKNV